MRFLLFSFDFRLNVIRLLATLQRSRSHLLHLHIHVYLFSAMTTANVNGLKESSSEVLNRRLFAADYSESTPRHTLMDQIIRRFPITVIKQRRRLFYYFWLFTDICREITKTDVPCAVLCERCHPLQSSLVSSHFLLFLSLFFFFLFSFLSLFFFFLYFFSLSLSLLHAGPFPPHLTVLLACFSLLGCLGVTTLCWDAPDTTVTC